MHLHLDAKGLRAPGFVSPQVNLLFALGLLSRWHNEETELSELFLSQNLPFRSNVASFYRIEEYEKFKKRVKVSLK